MSRYPKRAPKARSQKTNPSKSLGNLPAVLDFTIASLDSRQKEAGANQKEIVIDIAALRGKGYPAPVALNTGSPIAGKNN